MCDRVGRRPPEAFIRLDAVLTPASLGQFDCMFLQGTGRAVAKFIPGQSLFRRSRGADRRTDRFGVCAVKSGRGLEGVADSATQILGIEVSTHEPQS